MDSSTNTTVQHEGADFWHPSGRGSAPVWDWVLPNLARFVLAVGGIVSLTVGIAGVRDERSLGDILANIPAEWITLFGSMLPGTLVYLWLMRLLPAGWSYGRRRVAAVVFSPLMSWWALTMIEDIALDPDPLFIMYVVIAPLACALVLRLRMETPKSP